LLQIAHDSTSFPISHRRQHRQPTAHILGGSATDPLIRIRTCAKAAAKAHDLQTRGRGAGPAAALQQGCSCGAGADGKDTGEPSSAHTASAPRRGSSRRARVVFAPPGARHETRNGCRGVGPSKKNAPGQSRRRLCVAFAPSRSGQT
jgi:hypothetical protein